MSRDDPQPRHYRKMSERYASGGSLRRFESIKPHGHRINLREDHFALVNARTIFPKSVVEAVDAPRLLVDGVNSRKIGRTVMKGRLRGCPIFTLTLEERATCPRTCQQWSTCYGNSMHFAARIRHGEDFERLLWGELADKQATHPDGFLVRLHILGDFYSVDYAEFWAEALEAHPALNIFGYTAHEPDSEIGAVIRQLLGVHPDRFHVRFSGWNGPTDGSIVVDHVGETEHQVCPAQLYGADDKPLTEACATCGLCWHSDRTIAFLRH